MAPESNLQMISNVRYKLCTFFDRLLCKNSKNNYDLLESFWKEASLMLFSASASELEFVLLFN